MDIKFLRCIILKTKRDRVLNKTIREELGFYGCLKDYSALNML